MGQGSIAHKKTPIGGKDLLDHIKFCPIFWAGILFGIYKYEALTKDRAFVVAFGMGAIAAGSTAYPFVKCLDDDPENPVYFPHIVVIDFANKIWSLILVTKNNIKNYINLLLISFIFLVFFGKKNKGLLFSKGDYTIFTN